MMGVQVVLVLSLLDSVFSAATAGCPCLVDDGGALSAYRNPDNTLNYQGHSYPSDYGFGACKQWDIDPNPLPPYCTSPAPPEFCGDSWCYIDPNNCDLPLQYSSGVFPDSGLTFSSQTCGNAGTYSDYFSTGSGHSLTELADVVEDYVKSLTQKLEFAILENDFTSACDYTSSCHCQTCTPSTAWGTDVDFTRSLLKPYQDDPNSVTTLSSCLAGDADSYFSRVAGREYQNVDEFATLYVGFQEDGVFMQWPAMEFCSATYDPRFRPWYAAAATNPKMAVMVIDVSGSMRGTRIQLARQAALAVLDTLTAADQVGIVLFNEAPTNVFGPFHVSEGNRTAAIAFINANVVAGGGTAFTAPINLGLDMLASSEHCDSLLLFMTDGVPNAGFEMQESDYLQIKARAAAHNSTIFTYALGNCKSCSVIFSVSLCLPILSCAFVCTSVHIILANV